MSGPPARDGWLGAAAASTVCWRAGVARWTRALPPVLLPAELLGLPLKPSETLPAKPFDAPDARERGVAAAKRLGAAWVDGRVAYEQEQFVLHLELKAPSGEVLARGDGSNRLLVEAVRAAMEPLWGPGRISLPEKLPPEQGQLLGAEAPMLAVAVKDLQLATEAGSGIEAAVARLPSDADRSGALRSQVEFSLAVARGGRSSLKVALDRSSPLRLAWSAVLAAETGTPMDAAALADELTGLRAATRSPVVQRALLEAEARVRLAAGQNEETTNLVLAGLDQFRFTEAWEVLGKSQMGRPGAEVTARAFAAWSPHLPGARGLRASLEDGVTLYERQTLLAPDSRVYTVLLGNMYLAAGRLSDARLLGARAVSRPELRIAGETVLFLVECGEARFRAALARARRFISTAEHIGAVEDGDWAVVAYGHTIARLVGEEESFVELVYSRLLAPEPPRIDPGPWAITAVASACPYGAPDVARACAKRIQALVDAGYFYDLTPADRARIAGAAAFTRGDYAGAVAEFRNGGLGGGLADRGIVAEAFDRTGDPATASSLDAPVLTIHGFFNGVTMAHLREARRAAARGDHERARALAQRVVDAWSVADVEVPVVAEMRALLREK